jgi:hypothetical protein
MTLGCILSANESHMNLFVLLQDTRAGNLLQTAQGRPACVNEDSTFHLPKFPGPAGRHFQPSAVNAAPVMMSFPLAVPAFPPAVDVGAPSSSQSDSAVSTASMQTAAEKKKFTRAATKELISKLDELLPPVDANVHMNSTVRSCGSRALGRTGRSLISILQDAAMVVRHKKTVLEMARQAQLSHQQGNLRAVNGRARSDARTKGRKGKSKLSSGSSSQPVPAPAFLWPCPQAPPAPIGLFKQAMVSSHSIITIEVVFPSCHITSISAGFVDLIQQRCVSLSSRSVSCLDSIRC